MSIVEVDVSQRPVCPGCNTRDKVECLEKPPRPSPLPEPSPWVPPVDLSQWWCARCNACLAALPVKSAGGLFPPDPDNPIEGIFTDAATRREAEALEEPVPVKAKPKRSRKRKEISE